MNAAVLVSNVVRKGKTWPEVADELERFWREGIALKEGTTASQDIVPKGIFRIFPWWKPWTKDAPKWPLCTEHTNLQSGEKTDANSLATEEAARRYYSTKHFVFNGKKVFSIKEFRDDMKFLDESTKRVVLNDIPLRQEHLEIFQ
jgi:hypothetical protein